MNKEPTCYKNSENPSPIDFTLTNNPRSFFKTNTFFTGLPDFHKLVLSVFKTTFCKSKPKEITYRNFKNFEEESFNQELRNNLINNNIESYEFFEKVFSDTRNIRTPLKKKSFRANHTPYVKKTLRKVIMRRSNLRTINFKKRTPESLKNFRNKRTTIVSYVKKNARCFLVT